MSCLLEDIDPTCNNKCPYHGFLKTLIPDYEISILWFLIDIGSIFNIFNNLNFMPFDRYWFHVQDFSRIYWSHIPKINKFPYHVCLIDIDLKFKISNTLDGSLRCLVPVVSTIFKMFDFRHFESSTIQKVLCFFLEFFGVIRCLWRK